VPIRKLRLSAGAEFIARLRRMQSKLGDKSKRR
jgi:hypothetical protein